MARRGKDGFLEELFDMTAALPWWFGVSMALVAYVVLHYVASVGIVMRQVGVSMFVVQALKVLASLGQYVLPLLFLAGAVASVIGRHKRQGLLAEVAESEDGAALRAMGWRDFELLVGEAFRLRGYGVHETGGAGVDGGVDLQLTRGGEIFLVQCKHWRAFNVPVNVVRELYGVMAAQGAAGGFVVTSGVFTADAWAFAQKCNIELIDGVGLKKMIDAVKASGRDGLGEGAALESAGEVVPACPRCGAAMVRRLARQGVNAGREFWGCSEYPRCRGVRSVKAP